MSTHTASCKACVCVLAIIVSVNLLAAVIPSARELPPARFDLVDRAPPSAEVPLFPGHVYTAVHQPQAAHARVDASSTDRGAKILPLSTPGTWLGATARRRVAVLFKMHSLASPSSWCATPSLSSLRTLTLRSPPQDPCTAARLAHLARDLLGPPSDLFDYHLVALYDAGALGSPYRHILLQRLLLLLPTPTPMPQISNRRDQHVRGGRTSHHG